MTIDIKYLEKELAKMKLIVESKTISEEHEAFEEVEQEINEDLFYYKNMAQNFFCSQCLTENNLENIKAGAEIIKKMKNLIDRRFK